MRKLIALSLAVLMLLGGISAWAEEDTLSGSIVIALENDTGIQEAWEAVEAAYEAIHPGVDIVVALQPHENYATWIQAAIESDNIDFDLFHGNYVAGGRKNKTINYFDYLYDESPYSDGEWIDQFAFGNQVVDNTTGVFDVISLNATQVLWFYNADIFEEVGVTVPTTWDEFIDVCEKIEAAGYQAVALSGDYISFDYMDLAWLCQCYGDQTTRNLIEYYRAQPGDYCYDEDVDGVFKLDLSDPFNDDISNYNYNTVRYMKAIKDGLISPSSAGMKAMWTNFAKLMPKYCGGDNFFGTDTDSAKAMFLQGKAAISLDGSWFFSEYLNAMDAIADGGEDSGIKPFEIGTFNMPSMEGEEFLAPARTLEVATGFISAIDKGAEHNEMVMDFIKWLSSSEGYGVYFSTLIANGGGASVPLVYGVEVEDERLAALLSNITYIGNVQKGLGVPCCKGGEFGADGNRNWYDFTVSFLKGEITIDEWGEKCDETLASHWDTMMESRGISESDLETPQNEPTGN